MKYIYVDRTKILPFTKRQEMILSQRNYIYANEEDTPVITPKELVIEEKPTYDEKTQRLVSYFEDGEVITQKFIVEEIKEEEEV